MQERLARIYGYGKAGLYACGIGQCVIGYGEEQEVIAIGPGGLPGHQILRRFPLCIYIVSGAAFLAAIFACGGAGGKRSIEYFHIHAGT